jgi:hypothetical protein
VALVSNSEALTYLGLQKSASAERRYSFGPLYAPLRADAHGEYVEPDQLQDAVHAFVRMSAAKGRKIHLQHHDMGVHVVGEWVEVVAWPEDHSVTLTKAGSAPRTLNFPAGTCWLGIIWTPDAWPLVKSGKIGGLSMGGRAVRVGASGMTLKDMGDHLHKSGRVLSTRNVQDLRDCIRTIEDIIARDPTAAAEAGYAKSKDGVLVVNEAEQVVYHLCGDGCIQTLKEAEK